MHFPVFSLLALLPLAAHALPAPVDAAAAPRAFSDAGSAGGGGSVSNATSVVSLKDPSTLSSLVVYNPSSTAASSPTGTADANADTADTAAQTLASGDSAAFNPTPSTTLSFLGNVSTASTATAGTSGSSSGVVAAAASGSAVTTAGSGTSGAGQVGVGKGVWGVVLAAGIVGVFV
ncbi:hypothetical protein IAT38_000517 [Cryptococcus sp. DSM 104549]